MVKLKISKYITEEVIVTFATLVLGIIIELIKQINLAASEAGEVSPLVIQVALHNLRTWQALVNVFLITVILWFIIGIVKLLGKTNFGRRRLIITMIAFIFAIVSIVWYMLEVIYPSNLFTIIFGSIISVLFFLLLIYFLHDDVCLDNSEVNTNNIVASEPNSKKR